MSLLVTGATGQLGTAFCQLVPDSVPVGRAELDLASADLASIRDLLAAHRPHAVVNCAAYTAVDAAESEEALAARVNGEAVGLLARAAGEAGVPLVTFSSDYVFDGRSDRPYVESDPTDPVNAYGRTKLAGERAALAESDRTLVIRTSWVISPTHPNFVATMLRLAGEGRELTVVDDQVGSPTVVTDLARAALELLNAGAGGVVHVTNQGETTWYRLAREAIGLAGLNRDLVSPCATEDYPTPAPRPAYSVLGSERLGRFQVTELPLWVDSLPEVVSGQRTRLGL